MKTIGLLGGISWQSTLTYYRMLNEGINSALGGLHSAKIILNSVDFDPIEKLQREGNWEKIAEILSNKAKTIQAAKADFLLICANTTHNIASNIEASIQIPLLHIADAAAEVLIEERVKTVGLLGTAYTMEQNFYKGRLKDKYGINVVVPNKKDIGIIHKTIYEELCFGKIVHETKLEYLRIIDSLADSGCEAVILGCTEIGMLIKQSDTKIKLFDTLEMHVKAAVKFALT